MRILFASPHCALDRSSGAAISITTQLEELARLGWSCESVTGTVTSVHEPVGRHFAAWGLHRTARSGRSILLGTTRGGVEHLVVPMHDTRRTHITSDDEHRFFDLVREQLRHRRPDLLYIYGKGILEQAIMREARREGIATVFYLANASYRDPELFETADAVFTPSRALACLYGDRLGLSTKTIGSFTRPLGVTPGQGDAVLFVNPEPGKGTSFLIAIARRCLTELPQVRFLVVESRGTKQSAARQFDVDWAELPTVGFLPQQPDLSAAFRAARLLLCPALSFDAAPRVIVEANHAGLPVLSSAHGGSPEMLDGAGFTIDVAPRYRTSLTTMPDDDAVAPWIEHLRRLWHDQDAYALARARGAAAAARHRLPQLAQTLSRELAVLVEEGRGR